MGPFMRSSNTKFKTEVYIIICLTLLTLFSTYKSISTYPTFELHSFYPLIMLVTSILCSIITSFIYSKITKNDLKAKPNIIASMLFPLMLGINVPIYLVIIGSILIELISKFVPSKIYFINIPLIVGLIVLLVCHFILKINPYLFYGEINIISNMKDIGTYESLITPYGGMNNFLFGFIPSVIGGCAFICILSIIFLTLTRSIKWKIVLSSILTMGILAYFTGNFSGIGNFYILYILFTSSTLFGLLFTSISASPTTPIGQVLYGIFIGILTIIIRYFVSLDEAIFISIFVINFLIPILDKVGARSRFHINRSLLPSTIIWVLIVSICIYMFINFKTIDEFKIISKEINNEITSYVVSNENNVGKITAKVVVNNKKITTFEIEKTTDNNVNKIDKDFINSIINNPDDLDSIENLQGYDDTCNSLKAIIRNIMNDYVVYKEEVNYEILSKNVVDYQYIYIARNYDIKAKVVFKYKRLYNIEIIEMNEKDLNEINNSDLINNIIKYNSTEEVDYINKSGKLLIELINNVKEEYNK